MIPYEGGSTTSTTTSTVKPYESFANPDKKVNVDVDDLVSYVKAMMTLRSEAQAKAMEEVMPIGELVRLGLSQPPADGVSAFPEGMVMAQAMRQRQADFQAFFADVTEGIQHLGSAAAVIAEMYQGTDDESAASVEDVAFVFQDPNAKPPAGFDRKFETWSDIEARAAEQAAKQPMALSGSDNGLVNTSVATGAGVATYQYSDGSYKVVQSYYDPAIGGTRTTTSYYAKGGALLQTNTEADGKTTTGNRVQTTSTTRYDGESGTGTQSTSTTETRSDGTLTVSSETATVNEDGETVGDVKEGETITVTPGEHSTRTSTSAGPVERAVQDTGSYGTQDWVQATGRTY